MKRFRRLKWHIMLNACAFALPATCCGASAVESAKSTQTASVSVHLSYLDTKTPDAIPVVLIHAFPLNKGMWDDQVKALKGTARVIAFDIRGLGDSGDAVPYTLEFVVDDLIALLDRLKIDKAVVCGLSMGGFVALRAVERDPERFRALVLADTKSGADSDLSKLGRYRALRMIEAQGLPAYADSFLKLAIAPGIQAGKPAVFDHAKSLAEANTPAGVSAALLALASRTDTTAGLSDIKVPTLIMNGEFDSVIPAEEARALHEKIKGSELYIVPKAGHLSNLENPEAFNARLIQFIEGLKAPR